VAGASAHRPFGGFLIIISVADYGPTSDQTMYAALLVASTLLPAWPVDGTVSRRSALLAAGALPAASAAAYDTLPTVDPDLVAMEKQRAERAAKLKKNVERIQPYLKKIKIAEDATAFADACDSLSLWIIGEGSLPEGIDAREVKDVIQATYDTLPKKGYACEATRTNKGVCFSPGPPADDAYTATIKELRKYATRKGKGALISDGVSAANTAAF
jgi:hypothetical protein